MASEPKTKITLLLPKECRSTINAAGQKFEQTDKCAYLRGSMWGSGGVTRG